MSPTPSSGHRGQQRAAGSFRQLLSGQQHLIAVLNARTAAPAGTGVFYRQANPSIDPLRQVWEYAPGREGG
jgi:hypothetical protein